MRDGSLSQSEFNQIDSDIEQMPDAVRRHYKELTPEEGSRSQGVTAGPGIADPATLARTKLTDAFKRADSDPLPKLSADDFTPPVPAALKPAPM